MSGMNQLIIAPILLPLLTAALMLLIGEKHRWLKARLNLLSTALGLGIAVTLLMWGAHPRPGRVHRRLPAR
ncbi:formate hydrogenlyase subunit 3/multisubunit Na+/H+ antiporter MnhD subunit [Pseudomonas hunanensis]|nr:formate hydrogenlyase subunit 3/multisubunit Na+/H+ antiporter MnhD subunit [Pseudomonas hunanensis]